MRLLDTSTFELHEFYGKKIPKYAILSHRWEEGETTYKDIRKCLNLDAPGWKKVRSFCNLAAENDYEYAWIDTCCIDKTSSAELTEAINSMYRWYEDSTICYVYLSDVTKIEHLPGSQWFTRGWTLQELLAPYNVVFISNDWKTVLGNKNSLDEILSKITGIDDISFVDVHGESIATRMSWAANRECEREEDLAYSLLGIFRVNMPLLYGEGENALMRIQLEILRSSDDESIFPWSEKEVSHEELRYVSFGAGMLASQPSLFAGSKYIRSINYDPDRPPYSMTNKGLEIQPFLVPHLEHTEWYLLPLNCALMRDHHTTAVPLHVLVRRLRETFPGLLGRHFRRNDRIYSHLDESVLKKFDHDLVSDPLSTSTNAKDRELTYFRQYLS